MFSSLYAFVTRLFGNVAVLLQRNDINAKEKLRVLFAYYRLLLLHRSSAKNVSFLKYTITTPALKNTLNTIQGIFVSGVYTFDTQSDSPRIIDCGGNIGIATLFFKRRYPNARITVFEPGSTAFQALKKNTTTLRNIYCIQAAVGSHEGTIQFWEAPGWTTQSTTVKHVYEKKREKLHRFVKKDVPVVKLSRYVHEPIDLLKLDIEGSEGVVISELAQANKLQHVREIIFEYHYNTLNTENNFVDIVRTLEQHKYKLMIYGNTASGGIKKTYYHFMVRALKI
jgi:FkbM family methyltransferase